MDGLLIYNFADCRENLYNQKHICYNNNSICLMSNTTNDKFILDDNFTHINYSVNMHVFNNRDCLCYNKSMCLHTYKELHSYPWNFVNLAKVDVPLNNYGELNFKGFSISETFNKSKNLYYNIEQENPVIISNDNITFRFGKGMTHEINGEYCDCYCKYMCIHSYRLFRLRTTKNVKLMIKPNC